jgi:hypothetical protein
MMGVEVLYQHEGNATIGGHIFEELREGFQATGGSANTNDRKTLGVRLGLGSSFLLFLRPLRLFRLIVLFLLRDMAFLVFLAMCYLRD